MTRNLILFTTRATALAAIACAATIASAQVNDVTWNNAGVGDWNVGSNWDPFSATPEAAGFNEEATIDNGGTAFLTASAPNVGAVTLGTAGQTTGTLEIRNGGSLTVVNNGTTSGNVEVGVQGSTMGTLIVERGASLTARTLRSGAGDSAIQFGVGAGAGVATINTVSTVFRTDTRMTSDTMFTTGQLILGGASNLITEVSATTQPTISVTGFADLGGTLTFDFDGVTPTSSSTWTMLDAAAISSGFDAITSTADLSPGLRFGQEIVAAGARQELMVTVEEDLTLFVNRSTGAASLMSESSNAVSISAYNLRSDGGTINTGYTTLESQSLGGFAISGPAGITAEQTGELTSTGGFDVGAAGVSFGTLYTAPALPAFGTAVVDDLRLDYVRDDGTVFTAETVFDSEASNNNLVLTIDPSTGNARLTNESTTDLNLDVYSIGSVSESLLTTWDSLADQGSTGWQEANPSAGRVSELNPTNSLPLAAGGSIDLDGLWDTAAVANVDDITLEFRDTALGEFDGFVFFETLTDGIAGDYNNDGIVNAIDYTVWRDAGPTDVLPNDTTPGTVDGADLTVWQGNYGASLGSPANAVPEPTTLLGMVSGLLALLLRGRRANQSLVAVPSPSLTRSPAMTKPLACSLALGALLSTAAVAQPVKITATEVMNLPGAFTDGSITITPFDESGVVTGFGPAGVYFGPISGSNENAINDVDGDPLTTDDRDSLGIELASGVSLTEIQFGFSRANPITLSGFGSDPEAYFINNPNSNATLAYDPSLGTLAIFHNFFGGNDTIIGFGNGAASDGQSLLAEVTDFNQAGPQLAFSGITYDPNPSGILAGDVDGLNGVTLDDFQIIKDNFWSDQARLGGDLTGDGFVSLVDFAQWEANFAGNSFGLAGTLPVPEPTAGVIALFALTGLAGRVRR